MSKAEEQLQTCELCGATIYPEHIARGAADQWHGKLLCPHCLQEQKQIAAVNPAVAYADQSAPTDAKPITLLPADETEEAVDRPSSSAAIRAFGPPAREGTGFGPAAPTGQYRRPLLRGSHNATRCRTFHCKLTDASMAHMSEVINQWVDSDDDIEIKFATSSVGVVEGKSSLDPNLFVTVFY